MRFGQELALQKYVNLLQKEDFGGSPMAISES